MNVRELGALVDHITVANTPTEEARLVDELTTIESPVVLSFINANTMNIAREDRALLQDLLDSSLLLRDGVGMSILMRMIGKSPGLNSNGTDFIPKIANEFRGRSVALLGTEDAYVTRAAEYAKSVGCDVVLVQNGFQHPQLYLQKVRETRPDLVVLGMGTPKQERVAQMIARRVEHPVVIVNGGAILDRWAGRFRRAPALVRRLRAEWVYRFAREPQRLWRRYLIGNWSFMAWALSLALARKRGKLAISPTPAPWPPIPDKADAELSAERRPIGLGARKRSAAPQPQRSIAGRMAIADHGGEDA
jgi:N-acetylglucosaminyldiphosphoundecaprenol N-acetyl-beta-D-mannosaminyltransferase